MKIKTYKVKKAPKASKIRRPSFVSEIKSVIQPFRLLAKYNRITKDKQGKGQRVILFPGLKTSSVVMAPLKNYLTTLGYSPEHWGLGFNDGKVEEYRDTMLERLKGENSEEKVTLVGWSLGGVVAREVARELPQRVSGVVCFGSPIVGGPKHTVGARHYKKSEVKRIGRMLKEKNKSNPIQAPMSIIFTKSDSIVSWPACLDTVSPNVKHYEVKSTHLSMGIDPSVWAIVAEHLQEHAS